MSGADLAGRTFLVTGANSGLGRATVEALAERGGAVVLASRSDERTRPVVEAIRQRYPAADARFLQVDVADLRSVHRAAESFLHTGQRLDVLMNNAGVAGTRALSADGFDLTVATNHIGPFLLTNLLLPRLLDAPQGRVVNVSSIAHLRPKTIDWSVLGRRDTANRSGFAEYGVTKLMNVLHAKELARRLGGTRVTTYALNPGGVASNIWRSLPSLVQRVLKLFLLSNEEGAKTQLHCATAPELAGVSGRYYEKLREARCNPLADDATLARELWTRTEAAIAEADRRTT